MTLALAVGATGATADPLPDADRATLRRRLSGVRGGDASYARARLMLGALELGDERPLAAADALEDALAAGVEPRTTALSLLLWSYARAGDRPRALGALARWPEAPALVAAPIAGPLLTIGAALAAGHDTNVRLDADTAGPGVAAPWVAASADLTLRPLRRRDRLALRLALDQRVHVSARARASAYDIGRATAGVAWDQSFAGEGLHGRVDAWGQESFGDDLQAHFARTAGLDARLGLHPPGAFEAGVWGSVGLRDLDGGGLGDPAANDQDGGTVVAGLFAETNLPGPGVGVSLRSGYHRAMARSAQWDAQGVQTEATVALRVGRFGLAASGGWLFRSFDDTIPARAEHRVDAGIEATVALGALSPFVRATGEWSLTDAPRSFDRFLVAGGVAVRWETP